jgi:chromosome segregation ATPase
MDIKEVLNQSKNVAVKVGSEVQADVVYLKSKPFYSSWLVVLIIAVVLVGGTYWVTSGYEGYKKAIEIAALQEAHAKQTEDLYNKFKTQFDSDLQRSKEELQALIDKQKSIGQNIVKRNVATQTKIQQVTAKDRTVEQVKKDVEDNLLITPVLSTTNSDFIFSLAQTQQIVALKINSDRLEQNIKDIQNQLTLEQEKTARLQQDLSTAITALNQATTVINDYKDTVAAYKKAAKKSVWQKVRNGAIVVGVAIMSSLVTKAIIK